MPAHFAVLNPFFIAQLQSQKHYQHLFTTPKYPDKSGVSPQKIVGSRSELTSEIKAFLLKELGRVLQLQSTEYDERSGFFDLGMDSIMAVELFEAIQKYFAHNLVLSTTIVFDLPNIVALTDYLVNQLIPEKKTEEIDIQKMGDESIAIVGMACRLLGKVNTPKAYWELLCEGKDTATPVPLSRWNPCNYYDPNVQLLEKYTLNRHILSRIMPILMQIFLRLPLKNWNPWIPSIA